jgi:hypothetical protein
VGTLEFVAGYPHFSIQFPFNTGKRSGDLSDLNTVEKLAINTQYKSALWKQDYTYNNLKIFAFKLMFEKLPLHNHLTVNMNCKPIPCPFCQLKPKEFFHPFFCSALPALAFCPNTRNRKGFPFKWMLSQALLRKF